MLILPVVFMPAQTADIIDRTAELLRSGNTRELASIFSSNVDMTILGDQNFYSNVQAEQVLNTFFKQRQPRSLKILHRITSNANYRYGVVILNTSNGAYRIAFSLKNVNGKFEMDELRIESEKEK
jgi:hypothetical protein